MALEDVVQGVKISVSADGVDDAKNKIAELEKSLGDLQKTAETATGSPGGRNGGNGGGVAGLSQAFDDLHSTGAEAFSQIARAVSGGDITGLASLLGGKLGGAAAEATKSLFSFVDAQDAVILKNATMAKEFGTTPAVMQGMKEGFEAAGVSGTQFERLVTRMSRQVANDYSSMMKNVREENVQSEKSAMRVEEANRKVQQSFGGTEAEHAINKVQAAQEKYLESLGVPKEAFAAQEKYRAQREAGLELEDAINASEKQAHEEQMARKNAQIEKEEALNAERDRSLRSVTHIQQELEKGKASADVAEASVGTIRQAFERMAGGGPGGQAAPVDVLIKQMEALKTGALDSASGLRLVGSEMGSARAGGLGGQSAEQIVQLGQEQGAAPILRAMQGKSEVQRLGLEQTEEQRRGAERGREATEHLKDVGGSALTGIGNWLGQVLTTPLKRVAGDVMDDTIGNFQNIRSFFNNKMFGTEFKPTESKSWTGGGQMADIYADLVPGQVGQRPVTAAENAAAAVTGGASQQAASSGLDAVAASAQSAATALNGIASLGPGVSTNAGLGASQHGGFSRGGQIRIPGFADGGGFGEDFGVGQRPVLQIGVGPTLVGALGGAAAAVDGKGFFSSNLAPAPDFLPDGGGSIIPGFANGGIVGFADGGQTALIGAKGQQMDLDEQIQEVKDEMNNFVAHTSPGNTSQSRSAYDQRLQSYRDKIAALERKKQNAAALYNAKAAQAYVERQEALKDRMDRVTAQVGDVNARNAAEIYQETHPGSHVHMGPSFSLQNEREKAQRDLNRGYWDGGTIPGFADGGQTALIGAKGQQMDLDEQIQEVKDEMNNFVAHTSPGNTSQSRSAYDQRLQSYRDKIAALERKKQNAAALYNAKAAQAYVERQEALKDRMDRVTAQVGDVKARNVAEIYQETHPGSHVHMGPSFSLQNEREKAQRDLNRGYWDGGIPGFAMGSVSGPGTGTSDSILARLSNGEFVMRAASVRAYGEGFMHAINNMTLPPPKYAMGGMVPAPSLPRFAEGGMSKPDSTLHLHVGGEVFGPMKAPEAVATQLRKFAVGQQTTSTGHPSWAGG